MTDLRALLDIVAALNTPILGALAWLVWRIYSNHLPHILGKLNEIGERISTVEGNQQVRIERDRRGRR